MALVGLTSITLLKLQLVLAEHECRRQLLAEAAPLRGAWEALEVAQPEAEVAEPLD